MVTMFVVRVVTCSTVLSLTCSTLGLPGLIPSMDVCRRRSYAGAGCTWWMGFGRRLHRITSGTGSRMVCCESLKESDRRLAGRWRYRAPSIWRIGLGFLWRLLGYGLVLRRNVGPCFRVSHQPFHP